MRYLWAVSLGLLIALTLGHVAVAELGVSPETITLAGNRPSWLSQNLPLPQSYSLPGDLASRVTTTLTLNDPQGITFELFHFSAQLLQLQCR